MKYKYYTKCVELAMQIHKLVSLGKTALYNNELDELKYDNELDELKKEFIISWNNLPADAKRHVNDLSEWLKWEENNLA